MKNNELLKKYAGISTRIRRIFAYHYDQIQREVQTEISTLTPELQDIIVIDLKKHLKNLYSRQRPSGRDDNPIYLLLQCHQEMEIQSQENRNPSST